MSKRYKAVVIGTGFGGAITSCRLSKKWPGEVLVLERGKRYPMGSFPRKPHDMAQNFFSLPDEKTRRPKHVPKKQLHGMFDIRNYDHMDVVLGAGLGGGSLIYANVFMEPPEHVFDERWVSTIKLDQLQPYYDVAKSVLGSRPIPDYTRDIKYTGNDPRRRITRTELFKTFSEKVGRSSELVDLNVFFGNDPDTPLGIGLQDDNRYGAQLARLVQMFVVGWMVVCSRLMRNCW